MTKKELKSTFIFCIIGLIIGGIAKGLGWLNVFVDVIGFLVLCAATVGIILLLSAWHIDNYNTSNLKKTNMVSICFLGLTIVGVLIGSFTKLTFISVVSGIFSIYNLIVLVICLGGSINASFERVGNGEPLIDDRSDDEEEKVKIKVE